MLHNSGVDCANEGGARKRVHNFLQLFSSFSCEVAGVLKKANKFYFSLHVQLEKQHQREEEKVVDGTGNARKATSFIECVQQSKSVNSASSKTLK